MTTISTPTRERPRALVIGGSLSGLFAANLLSRIGWDVTVFERASADLSGRGTGLGTRDELFDVMRRSGVEIDDSITVDVRSRIALDRDGTTLCEVPIGGMSTAWDCIYRALKRALPADCYRLGMQLERFEQDHDGVTAIFAGGMRAQGALLIGADGMRSTVRRQLMPDREPRYAGYINWRGAVEEQAVPDAVRPMLRQHMVFCFPDGELSFSHPMPAPHTGNSARRIQFVWFRPVDYEFTLPRMCTDESGHCHGVSIPPPLIRREVVDDLRASARDRLPPQIASLVTLAPQPILQPIYDLESPQISFGRVALIGDAAFVARPHVGTGVTKAALDAQSLADALAATPCDLEEALMRYERERRPPGHRLVARGRYLGGYLEASYQQDSSNRGPRPIRNPRIFLGEFGPTGVIDGA
jgi:2-polyprenyl-6-methoxyphenol hydroxylase-like FAD-dependent oxidoreductase